MKTWTNLPLTQSLCLNPVMDGNQEDGMYPESLLEKKVIVIY